MDGASPPPSPPRPTATRRTAKKLFNLPMFPSTSTDPKAWREQPRPKFRTPWTPKRQPGTQGVKSDSRMGSIFLQMMREPLDILLRETNVHGRSRNFSRKWRDISKVELAQHVGLTVAMGGMPKQDYTEYWTDRGVSETPKFREVMGLGRYKQILQNLHFQNEQEAVDKGWDVRGGPNRDSLYKIRSYWNATFKGFRKMRAPLRHNAVDESMIGFLGQFAHKQYIPSKPEPRGVKVYGCAESRSAYVHSGHIHSEEKFPGHEEGIIKSRVMNLLEEADILDQGFEVYTDSFYTSRPLAEQLLARNTLFAGTLSSSRSRGCPPIVCDRKSPFSKELLRGQAVFLHTEDLSICNWSDSANLVLLYSLTDVVEEFGNVERNIQAFMTEGEEGKYGYQKMLIPQPLIARLYNHYMGGVDLADQLCTNVVRYFRVKKWYKAVHNYLLLTACCNCYVIKKEMLPKEQKKKFTVRAARMLLAEDLLSFARQQMGGPSSRATALHLPIMGKQRKCAGEHNKRKRTSVTCTDCNKALCLDCYKDYHVKKLKLE